jgi:hypothetical protein
VLDAIATNEWRAKACGYHTSFHLLLVFVASAAPATLHINSGEPSLGARTGCENQSRRQPACFPDIRFILFREADGPR